MSRKCITAVNGVIAPTVAIIAMVTTGNKERELMCLPIWYVYGWFATINSSKAQIRVQ